MVKAEVKKEAAKPAAKPASKAAADKKADAANGKAAAKVKEEKQPKEKKEFDMPGQTREAPPEVRFRHNRRCMLRHNQSHSHVLAMNVRLPPAIDLATCMPALHRLPTLKGRTRCPALLVTVRLLPTLLWTSAAHLRHVLPCCGRRTTPCENSTRPC